MAHILASNPNTSHKLIISSNLGKSVRRGPRIRNQCYRVRRKNGRNWSGLVLQCSSSSTSSSELSFFDNKVGVQIENNGGAKLKEQLEYLVCEYGWRVRRLIENADEMKMAAQVQAEAFHVPVALFDDMFFQFFKAEVLSGLIYKLKHSLPNRYACLVVEPAETDQDSQEHIRNSSFQFFQEEENSNCIVESRDMISILWGFEFLALRAYEEDLSARTLYSNAGYQLV